MEDVEIRHAPILERSYRAIVDAVREGICLVGPDQTIEFANRAMGELLDSPAEQLIGRPFEEIVCEADRPFAVSLMAGRAEVGNEHYDLRLIRGGGVEFYAMISASRVLDEQGRFAGSLKMVTDITARKQYEEDLSRYAAELAAAQARAESATQAKSAFLATMSHEIRTPMNAILGMAALLGGTELTSRQREFVDTIRSSCDHLLGLINDILDFSKIEAGRMTLETVRFSPEECLENCIDLVAPQATAKGLDLGLAIDPRLPRQVLGDLTRVRQVVVNLLSNAVKFTRRGYVLVRASVVAREGAECRLQVEVRDTGIGIPADKLERLFKAFSQVDSSDARQYGGTGLGLAISQRLASLMGGRIEVHSQPDVGSTFIFEFAAPLPGVEPMVEKENFLAGRKVWLQTERAASRIVLRRWLESWGAQVSERGVAPPGIGLCCADADSNDQLAAATRVRCPVLLLHELGHPPDVGSLAARFGFPPESLWLLSRPVKRARLKEAAIDLLTDHPALQLHEPAEPVRDPAELRRDLRLLVAEDNPVNQRVLLLMLEDLGCAAEIANNGEEAFEMGRARSYDLIFMDVQMPLIDGFAATRKLREAGVKTRIVALTANAMGGDRERCLEAGMNDYLAKPVRPEELALALDAVRAIPGSSSGGGAAEPAEPGHFEVDWSIFDRLATAKSAARHLPQLLELVDTDSQRRIGAVRTLAAEGRWSDVRAEAHTLKGSVSYLGLTGLSALCKAIEERAQAEDGPAVAHLSQEFERRFPAARDALKDRIR